jgi:hypothetical protein
MGLLGMMLQEGEGGVAGLLADADEVPEGRRRADGLHLRLPGETHLPPRPHVRTCRPALDTRARAHAKRTSRCNARAGACIPTHKPPCHPPQQPILPSGPGPASLLSPVMHACARQHLARVRRGAVRQRRQHVHPLQQPLLPAGRRSGDTRQIKGTKSCRRNERGVVHHVGRAAQCEQAGTPYTTEWQAVRALLTHGVCMDWPQTLYRTDGGRPARSVTRAPDE